MLLGFADAGGEAGAAGERIRRAAGIVGAEPAILRSGIVTLASWSSPAGSEVDRDRGVVVDGRIEWDRGDAAPNVESLRRVAGDFALMGGTHDALVLASGPAGGHRPIYVTSAESGLVMASTSMSLLLALIPSRPSLDVEYLAGRAVAGFVDVLSRAGTPYRGISRLPPGEAWFLTPDRQARVASTFRPLAEREHRSSERDLAMLLRTAFQASVRRAMTHATRVGVMVGGGVDSSGLLAAAWSQGGSEGRRNVHAFAWDYATYHGDDRPYLDRLVQSLGVEPHRVRPREAVPHVGTSFVLDGMPASPPPAPLTLALEQRARSAGMDVLLTGVGGDSVLDGEPQLLGELALQRPLRALRIAARLRGPEPAGPAWRLRQYVVRPLLSRVLPSVGRRARARNRVLAPYPWAGARVRRFLCDMAQRTSARPPSLGSDPAQRYEELAGAPFLAEMSFARAQEEATTGCVRREPFFDDEFLRVVATLPPLSLLHGGYLRGLFRESMRGVVPDEVRLRETKAILQPALAEMVAAAGGFRRLEDLADVRMMADLGLAEPRSFRACFDALARDPARSSWYWVWPALAVEAFLREYDGHTGKGAVS